MDFQILIGAGCTLLGTIATQVFAMRVARLQADRADHREATQWDRERAKVAAQVAEENARDLRAEYAERERALQARREEFLVLVLTAQERVYDRTAAKVGQRSYEVLAAETASGAARKAYAVALLYLDGDLRKLGRDFYVAATNIDLALERDQTEHIDDLVSRWQAAFEAIHGYFWHGRSET